MDAAPTNDEKEEPVRSTVAIVPEKRSFFGCILFRFLLVYFFLSQSQNIFARIPGGVFLSWAISLLSKPLSAPIASSLFHYTPAAASGGNGSGDTTDGYIEVVCHLLIASIATLIWTIADFRRRDYSRVYPWYRLMLRLSLGASMISYGSFKLLPSQFPPPGLSRLVETYGESSPMGLLWTFMGFSPAYGAFCGLAEVVGGLLLLFPRFTMIGALVSFGVMSNVFMLNMCFDVPVKIYSFHLLVMSLLLLPPDAFRLKTFFFGNGPIAPRVEFPLFLSQRKNTIAMSVQLIFGAFVLVQGLNLSLNNIRERNHANPPYYGAWLVEEETISGVKQTDEYSWRYLIFEWPKAMQVLSLNRVKSFYKLEVAGDEKNLTISTKDKSKPWTSHMKVTQPDPNHLILTGDFVGYPAELKMRKVSSEFLLMNRGFHWINEYPFNR